MWTENALIDWFKNNKKQLVNSVLDVVRNETVDPLLVMMAGYPGSGKSEYIKSSAELSSLPVVDLDDLVALFPEYEPGNYYTYRKAAGRLLAAVFEEALKRKLSFVLEGTFSSEISLQNVKRALNQGYTVKIETAQKFAETSKVRYNVT